MANGLKGKVTVLLLVVVVLSLLESRASLGRSMQLYRAMCLIVTSINVYS